MKNLIFILLFLTKSICFSQNSEGPNLVITQDGYFYKNSWKPFTGNVLIEKENPKTIIKVKIKNGFEVLSELYQNDKLVGVFENGIEVKINNDKKSEFSKTEKFIDIANLSQIRVLTNYNENKITKEKTKFNGIEKFENTKVYYKNGIRVKIEFFYDENCEKIKESYELFHTKIGNIEFDEISQSYHGNYKIWNIDGTIIESGKYKFGQKT